MALLGYDWNSSKTRYHGIETNLEKLPTTYDDLLQEGAQLGLRSLDLKAKEIKSR